ADDKVGCQPMLMTVRVRVSHSGGVGVDVVDGGNGDAVTQVAAVASTRRVQVDEDLSLRVEPDRRADQALEINVVALAPEAQVANALTVAFGADTLAPAEA